MPINITKNKILVEGDVNRMFVIQHLQFSRGLINCQLSYKLTPYLPLLLYVTSWGLIISSAWFLLILVDVVCLFAFLSL